MHFAHFSSSLPLVPAGSNFEEINLKQVSILPLSRSYNIFCPHRPFWLLFSFQVQESPDNSMFSFQIGATSQEEGEEAASAESIALSDEVKAKL